MLCALTAQARVLLVSDAELEGPAERGIVAIEQALSAQGHDVIRADRVGDVEADYYVVAGISGSGGPAEALLGLLGAEPSPSPEALSVQKTRVGGKPAVVLCGADTRGLLYAALDTAERISWAGAAADPFEHIVDIQEKPFIGERAVSMYTMQRAYFESRLFDEEHWQRYFALLARSRVNSFVVIFGYENGGFLAPAYPYFFDVAEFPGVELVGITVEQQQRNTAAFQRMMGIAHEHGVDFGVAIWDHIYRGGVQGGGIAGASELAGKRVPGLVSGVNAENLAPYTKAGLTKFLKTFPEIDSLQFRMHGESGLKPDEMPAFWHEMFTMIREFKPEMRVDIRAKELPDEIINDGLDQGLNLRVATKYWMEQMGLPFHPTHINRQNQDDRRHGYADLLRLPQRYPMHWRLWNGGTTRLLLWADPDYVRRFAASARLHGGDSYEVNEMLATKMLGEPHGAEPRPIHNEAYRHYDYEFERYWHFMQVWGRLGYNPETPAEVWEHDFARRFGEGAGVDLMHGLHLASRVLPRIVASSYRYRWFPTTRGWAEMNPMDSLPEYIDEEGSDIAQFMSVSEEAKSRIEGTATAMMRPQENSRWFADTADRILRLAARAESAPGAKSSPEFVTTVTDLRILAHLARYHSQRLLAGVEYAVYKQNGDLFSFDRAVELESRAVAAWADIVEAAGPVYRTDLAFGVESVGFARHWKDELAKLRSALTKLKKEHIEASAVATKGAPRIIHTPLRRAGLSEVLRIQATILSNAKRVEAKVVVHGGGLAEEARMEKVGPGRYEATIPNPGREAALSYTIKSVDAKGREATYPEPGAAKPITLTVSADRTPPQVRVERPTKAIPGKDLIVRAAANDASSIKWLRLRYRHLTQFEDYLTVPMRLSTENGLYEGVIPGQFIDPEWNLIYYVEALDTHGNGRIYPTLDSEQPYVIVKVHPAGITSRH